jgi:hypothetical protein
MKTYTEVEKKEVTRRFGIWLDTYIATYFVTREFRENYTLGEHLAASIGELLPDDFLSIWLTIF